MAIFYLFLFGVPRGRIREISAWHSDTSPHNKPKTNVNVYLNVHVRIVTYDNNQGESMQRSADPSISYTTIKGYEETEANLTLSDWLQLAGCTSDRNTTVWIQFTQKQRREVPRTVYASTITFCREAPIRALVVAGSIEHLMTHFMNQDFMADPTTLIQRYVMWVNLLRSTDASYQCDGDKVAVYCVLREFCGLTCMDTVAVAAIHNILPATIICVKKTWEGVRWGWAFSVWLQHKHLPFCS